MIKPIYNKAKYLLALLMLMSFMTGCSSIKTYPNSFKKNMTVKTTTSSGSILQDVDTYLHIYTLDSKCKSDYLGTVDLDKPVKKVGLPVNKNLYLDFAFVKGGFFSHSSSRINSETLITPRKGRLYEVDVFYEDSIYDVSIWQKKSRKSKKRKLKLVPYEACKAKK